MGFRLHLPRRDADIYVPAALGGVSDLKVGRRSSGGRSVAFGIGEDGVVRSGRGGDDKLPHDVASESEIRLLPRSATEGSSIDEIMMPIRD